MAKAKKPITETQPATTVAKPVTKKTATKKKVVKVVNTIGAIAGILNQILGYDARNGKVTLTKGDRGFTVANERIGYSEVEADEAKANELYNFQINNSHRH